MAAAISAVNGTVSTHAQTTRARHTPAYRRETPAGTDTDDGPGDGVRRAHRDAGHGRADEGDGASRLGTEAADRLQLGDPHPHRLDDAPAAEGRPQCDGGMAHEDHPDGHVERLAKVAGAEQQHRDDPHGLLRVVGAVAQAVQRRRHQLQPPEETVDARRRAVPDQEHHQGHRDHAQHQPEGRRDEDECKDLGDAAHHDDMRTRGGNPGAGEPGDERVRRARRQVRRTRSARPR